MGSVGRYFICPVLQDPVLPCPVLQDQPVFPMTKLISLHLEGAKKALLSTSSSYF